MKKRMIFGFIAVLLCQGLIFQYVRATPDTQINSQYDLVFALDNSLEMARYDGLDDLSWMDALVGFMEQAPGNSSFAVVTKDSASDFGTIEETEEALYVMPAYNGTANPVQLLQTAAAALSARENSRKKMLVLSVASWYNQSELFSQIENVHNQGIEVVLLAFEKDEQKIAEIQRMDTQAVVCRDVRELAVNMSELYAEMVEEKQTAVSGEAMLLSGTTSAGNEYKTSFRSSKHQYSFSNTNHRKSSKGAYFSMLLNIYYLLPSYCSDSQGKGYSMYTGQNVFLSNTAYNIGKGNASEMFCGSEQNEGVINSLLSFWNDQVNQMLQQGDETLVFSAIGIAGLSNVIQENLKRRMPVLVSVDPNDENEKNYLIVGQEPSGYYRLFDAEQSNIVVSTASTFAGKNVTVIDTAQYFNIVRGTHYIEENSSDIVTNGVGRRITLKIPNEYENPVSYVHFGPADVTVIPDTEELTFEARYNSAEESVDNVLKFPVCVQVKYDDYTPNCYHSTLNYIIQLYTDVQSGAWYHHYVYDLTNQDIIHGRFDDNVLNFAPEEPITIRDYLTVLYFAADIQEDYNGEDVKLNQNNIVAHAKNNGFITEAQQENAGESVTRQEAADMLWKIFMSDLCRTPHSLVEYANFENTPFQNAWNLLIDKGSVNESYQNALQQLFCNQIMVGDSARRIRPTAEITRAEACTIVSKAMFKLKEFGKTIQPIFDNDNVETLQFNTVYSGNLSNYGGYTYQLNVQQDGLYRIEVSPGVRTFVYVYGAEVLPDQHGCYAFSKDTFPLVYLSGGANKSFTVQAIKENFTISNVDYNNGAGAKLGTNNKVSLKLSKNSAGTGTYQVSLYCAGSTDGEGGLRSETQEVTLNGSTSATVTFDNVALYGGGAGTIYTYVKVSLAADGVGAESNRIQSDVSGVLPQEIKFSNAGNRTNEHVIFDDHPEFIRECDLLDSTYFSPAVINHVDNLQPGNTYTLFSYHHIANSYSDERYRKGENNTIPANQDVYFDIVFHGTGRVAVKKIGYACGGIEERPWELLNSAFPNFNSSSLDYKIDLSGEAKFLSDEGFFGSSLLKINEKDNLGIGYGHVILQFEVESGSVNISTVAYKNKGSVTTPGTAKANFSGTIKSVYEDLETLKGMADSTQVMASDILNYVIDDTIQENSELPFIVKNQIYPNGRKNGVFTTNSSPTTENNSYMTPLSSVPVLKYYGDGVIRNETSGNVQTTVLLDTETPWMFDSSHSRFVKNYELTEELKFGPYANKNSLSPNEQIPNEWLVQIASFEGQNRTNVFNELDGFVPSNLENGKGIISVNPGFGHTYEINVRIQNSGTEPRRFNYYLYGGVSHVSWRYAVCNPTVEWSQAWTENISSDADDVPDIDAKSETKKIFSNDLTIPAGKCINLQLWLTIYTGSNPVIQNAMVIDPENEYEIDIGELAANYPQN